jgi:hypothetical protein
MWGRRVGRNVQDMKRIIRGEIGITDRNITDLISCANMNDEFTDKSRGVQYELALKHTTTFYLTAW